MIVTDDSWLDDIGILVFAARFERGLMLRVRLVLDVAPGFPVWTNYSFHLQNADGEIVIRYDNAPHHSELSTFPHHRHVGSGEAVEPSTATLHQIIDDIHAQLR